MLSADYTSDEVRDALDQMHPTRAPGPDGMCALFFQKFWHVVGGDVINITFNILKNEGDIRCINKTYIA